MQKDLDKWSNQARFIQMIIDGKLVVSKKKKADLVAELKSKRFMPFSIASSANKMEEEDEEEDDEEGEDVSTGARSYDYLLGVSSVLQLVS